MYVYIIVSEEVDMTTNLARGKPTEQSSTIDTLRGSSNAVDVETNSRWHACSATRATGDNWWLVDLEAVHDIRVVTLTSAKCCSKLKYYACCF